MSRGRRGRSVNGVLLLNKGPGVTSNRALQTARRLLNAAKAGHGGTLDPMATGLLPLAFGEATKFSADLLHADKAYDAEAVLGITTDTGDTTGTVLSESPVSVTEAEVKAAAASLTGEIEQIPPMYSALKKDGVALYTLARRGETVEREPRRVTIAAFDILAFDGVRVKMHCEVSKGTYIRTLIEDLGKKLGCGAAMSALCRTRVGNLTLDQAVTLEELEAADTEETRDAMLRPPDELLKTLPGIVLDEASSGRFRNGQRLALSLQERGRVKVYAADRRLLGTGQVNERGVLAPERLIAAEQQ